MIATHFTVKKFVFAWLYAQLRVKLSTHHFPPLTGSLAEVTALEAALQSRDHIKVPISGTRWTWEEDSKFPPITAVRRTKLWESEKYVQLRQRLRQPVPSPTVQVGGRFVTVDLHAPDAKKTTTGEEPTTPVTAPPSLSASRSRNRSTLCVCFG